MSSESEAETDKLDAHNEADDLPVCQTRNPRAATVIRLLGLLILRRIADSPVHAVECRHHYCREWIEKKRLAMTLFLDLSAKGERRASGDLPARVGDAGNKRNLCHTLREHSLDGHMATQGIL